MCSVPQGGAEENDDFLIDTVFPCIMCTRRQITLQAKDSYIKLKKPRSGAIKKKMLDFMINFCTQDQFLTHVVQTEEERSTEENAAGGPVMARPLARIRNIDITNHICLYKINV